jgi:hypothetical protein
MPAATSATTGEWVSRRTMIPVTIASFMRRPFYNFENIFASAYTAEEE